MPKLSFTLSLPVRILFGPGRLEELGSVVAEQGSKALVVLGERHAADAGLISTIEEVLVGTGVQVTTYSGVHPNPSLQAVLEGVQVARGAHSNVIVAVGGGSVMDVAKAISLGITHEGDLWEYRIEGSLSIASIRKTLPVVTVPTTAGSASEVSPAALITHNSRKEVIVSPHMFPVVTVVDPSLTVSLPSRATAISGFDCLIQGIEPLVAANANILSDAFAREAVALAAENLPVAVRAGADIEARCGMCLASILGGFAISQSGVGAIHALAAPLTARYGLAHGASLVPLTIPVVKYNSARVKEEYAWVARTMAPGRDGRIDLGDAILDLLQTIGLDDLMRFAINPADLDALVRDAQNPDLATNPVGMAPEDIRLIYAALGA